MVLAQVVPEILRKTIWGTIMPPPPILIRVKETSESYEAVDEIKIKQHKLTLEERLQTLQKLDDQILELTEYW